jgi:hypothetical protein
VRVSIRIVGAQARRHVRLPLSGRREYESSEGVDPSEASP